jgi:hypothetical protein
MAKVYDLPDGFEVPSFNFKDLQGYMAKEKEFIQKLKTWCVERMQRAGVEDKNVGVVIKFPVADGYALYMIAATNPVQLIHLPLGDAWSFQYVTRLTKKDIIEKARQQRLIDEKFGKKD